MSTRIIRVLSSKYLMLIGQVKVIHFLERQSTGFGIEVPDARDEEREQDHEDEIRFPADAADQDRRDEDDAGILQRRISRMSKRLPVVES